MKKRICLFILAFVLISSIAEAAVYSPGSLTVNFASTDIAAQTAYLPATHVITSRMTREILVTIPDSTNTITWKFEIVDDTGISRYSMPGLPKNNSYIFLIPRFVKAGYYYRLTPSGAPGSATIVTIVPTYVD